MKSVFIIFLDTCKCKNLKFINNMYKLFQLVNFLQDKLVFKFKATLQLICEKA